MPFLGALSHAQRPSVGGRQPMPRRGGCRRNRIVLVLSTMTHLPTQSWCNRVVREHNGVVVMRIADLGPRQGAVAPAVRGALRQSRPFLPLCAAALCGLGLAACDVVPLPDAALLQPQAPPQCKAPKSAKADEGFEGSEAAKLRRLDYEVQCYQQAEMIVRHRLRQLQEALQQPPAKADNTGNKRDKKRDAKRETAANP
jgi:hypothetical protein